MNNFIEGLENFETELLDNIPVFTDSPVTGNKSAPLKRWIMSHRNVMSKYLNNHISLEAFRQDIIDGKITQFWTDSRSTRFCRHLEKFQKGNS